MKALKVILIFLICILLCTCLPKDINEDKNVSTYNMPEYNGQIYVELNNNVPFFDESDMTLETFEEYSELDEFGRCGSAYANIGKELMPDTDRESISHIKPSGWNSSGYNHIDGKFLYNRCHLIARMLTGEDDNEKNLITGTRYMNIKGMLPFEQRVYNYIKNTDHHVLYRVTPIYEMDNLVASGVIMEAQSIEDDKIQFHVFVYNIQPGVVINYNNGSNYLKENETGVEIRGNSRSMIYHCPDQRAYQDMADSKYLVIFDGEKEAVEAGYRRANQ